MHFEFLVEDVSGKRALDCLIPRIINAPHTWRVFHYKGIGRIPKKLNAKADPRKRILLQELPRILRGYGRAFAYAPEKNAVILVCDLDDRCLKTFRNELIEILESCDPKPTARFCFAIEEMEAWLLGDTSAVAHAYPRAKRTTLATYVNDAVCGTWQVLAEAVYTGGAKALEARGWQAVGAEKSAWAEAISPFVDVENNASPSFIYFRSKLRELAN
jgi:hypothetical protein